MAVITHSSPALVTNVELFERLASVGINLPTGLYFNSKEVRICGSFVRSLQLEGMEFGEYRAVWAAAVFSQTVNQVFYAVPDFKVSTYLGAPYNDVYKDAFCRMTLLLPGADCEDIQELLNSALDSMLKDQLLFYMPDHICMSDKLVNGLLMIVDKIAERKVWRPVQLAS